MTRAPRPPSNPRRRPCWLCVLCWALVPWLMPAAAAGAPLDLVVEARYQRADGEWITFEVTDGDVLRSGNGLRITLAMRAPGHVYLAILGSSGKAALVLPPEGRNFTRPIPAGTRLALPPGGQFFELDQNTGREAVVAVATPEPLAEPRRVVRILEAAGADHGAAVRALEDLGAVAKVGFRHIAAAPLKGVDPGASGMLRRPEPPMVDLPRARPEAPAPERRAPVFTVVPRDGEEDDGEVLSEEGSLIPPGVSP